MEIEDFFPKYPNLQPGPSNSVLTPYDAPFNDVIVSKKEFAELKLKRLDQISDRSEKYNHQKIISRFLASMTPYNEILLFHEMGTGKTCSSIAAIEQLRYAKDSHIVGAYILARGQGLLDNFRQELVFTCTDGRYIPANYDFITDLERVHRIRKSTGDFYNFFTFETFVQKQIAPHTNEKLAQLFSNHVIVLDEVHNIREKEEKTVARPFERDPLYIYNELHRFLHAIRNSKIILMSGTVMKDNVAEFASIMNLILPLDDQFPVGKQFHGAYFENNVFRREKLEEFSNKIAGRVSYLKSVLDVPKIFRGRKIEPLKHFVVYPDRMSSFQSAAYAKAYQRDVQEKSIFLFSRQASLFVFPDGSYGSEGFNKYVTTSKHRASFRKMLGVQRGRPKGQGDAQQTQTWALRSELVNAIGGGTIEQRLENLSRYSSKYAAVIRTMLEKREQSQKIKAFVYSEFVTGGGDILFSKILELFGFSRAAGNESTKHPRYILLTSESVNARRTQLLVNRFNNEDNIDGEFISVIIGSRVISEGFTFKHIRQEFILTPHWNFSEILQAIARGWRLGSHQALIQRGDRDVKVEVYLHTSLPNNNTPSIDLEMYQISEAKDYLMKQVEHIVKLSAFDCPLTFERNKVPSIYDGTRECDYTACAYKCAGQISQPFDTVTYNLYYISTDLTLKRLQEYFRTNDSLEFPTLFALFAELNTFEVIYAVRNFIEDDVVFYNRFGQPSYLRTCSNFVFLTQDVKTRNIDVFGASYAANPLLHVGAAFGDILDSLFEDRIPDMLDTLFDESTDRTLIPEIMGTVPELVQRIVLQACVEAKARNLHKNQQPRDIILDYYRGYYSSFPFQGVTWWIMWFHKRLYGISRWSGAGRWETPVSGAFLDAAEQHIQQTRERFYKSPVGFYGLTNPQLGEFCLRDVRNISRNEKDLRKVAVGRRCMDYSQDTLIDLLVRRIKAPYRPPDYLRPVDREELARMVTSMKYHRKEDLETVEGMKRFIYWAPRKRTEICAKIQEWMEENRLIEPSFDCGTQQKQRARAD